MELKKEYKELIIAEFKDVLNLINSTDNIKDKLYYFSAAYGVVNRIMNIECLPILLFIHQTLQITVQSIKGRLSSSKPGDGLAGIVPKEFFELIPEYLSILIEAFEEENEDKIRAALQNFSTLAYANTGNGFYLYVRGNLRLSK